MAHSIIVNLLTHIIILKNIFLDSNNSESRFFFLKNYLKWYLYFKPRGIVVETTLQNGYITQVYPDSDSGVSNLFSNNVDYLETKFIRNIIDKGDFIIDCGCNVGNRTLVLADIIKGALLIDANEKCIERLKNNFSKNKLSLSKYHLICSAVGSTRGEVFFSDFGGTSCLNKIIENNDLDHDEQVPYKKVLMTTIDIEMNKINNPPCSFIKIDVEGYDLEALKGATKTLQNPNIKLVKFERWKTVSMEDFINFFSKIDWQIFALDLKGNPNRDLEYIYNSSNLFAMPKKCYDVAIR